MINKHNIEDPTLPQPKADTGGPSKVLFAEGLAYVTEQTQPHEAMTRFRRFLSEEKEWTKEQIEDFLSSRADLWPPVRRLVSSDLPLEAYAKACLASFANMTDEPIWTDYGGFLFAELPSLKAVYTQWWKHQVSRKRLKSLKEKLPAIKKTA